MNDELTMREATSADIPVLADHRRWMFEEMAVLYGKPYGPSELDTMTTEYTRYLEGRLGGDIQAWAGWVMALWFGGRSLEKIATLIWRGR